LQYDAIFEDLIFKFDGKDVDMHINNKELKFYDPEENMEYFNRLFNVLGIIDNLYSSFYSLDEKQDAEPKFEDIKYYVSSKFNNYNIKFEELSRLMHKYSNDFGNLRFYENQCECSYLPLYEVEIAYETEEFFRNLRIE
jgi:5-methylthioribose kinase